MSYILNIYSGIRDQGVAADIRTKVSGRVKTDLTPLPLAQQSVIKLTDMWHSFIGVKDGVRVIEQGNLKPIIRQSGSKPVSVQLDTLIKGKVRLGERGFIHEFKGRHEFSKLSTGAKKQINRDLLSLQKANVRQAYVSLSFGGETLFQGNVSVKTLLNRLTELYLYNKHTNVFNN